MNRSLASLGMRAPSPVGPLPRSPAGPLARSPARLLPRAPYPTAIPIAWNPLSTYTTLPVMAAASGLERNAAVWPTSEASIGRGSGESAAVYLIMVSMKPIALAARDAQGPAEIAFTRTPQRRPASYARVRVSDSSAALADDMPPP